MFEKLVAIEPVSLIPSAEEELHRYAITECYYGHIHGKAHQYAFEGMYEETKMHLISGDYIQFKPVKIV